MKGSIRVRPVSFAAGELHSSAGLQSGDGSGS